MALKRKRTSLSTGKTYQVFLSFRGPDTRQGFANVLHHALTDAGIRVFRADKEIQKGEYISDEILGAIREARIFVPIFSKRYASSKWCLMELSEMLKSMEASPESGKKILPVFYNVSVDVVKLKKEKGRYSKALFKHREKYTPDTVQQWEEALREAGKIKGYEVKDIGDGEFAKMLVREISMKLKVKHKYVTEYLVQRDDQVEALMDLLDIEASGVRFVRIHGMGGIGKTTLAKVVFNKICDRYKCCCFLADVRESCRQQRGIENLRNKLLNSLYPTLRDTMDEDDGIVRMKEMFRQQKVLIVLDDVDDKEQIDKLAGDASWFGRGSRIIITTRNKQALKKEFETLEVAAMEPEEALRLFSMRAFDKDSPPKGYHKVSEEAVASTGRLPLALEVIGSHLRDVPRKDWAEVIKRLKKVPHKMLQKKLRISYDALDYGPKQMFLDVACFFIGHEKTYPMYMWDACEFDAKMGLRELIHKSLVKIVVETRIFYSEEKKVKRLWMHDQLRDLGREIVRAKSREKGVTCNRLWMHGDASEVLKEEEDKKNIEMLRLCYLDNESIEPYQNSFGKEELSGFCKLRYLECHRARITGDWSRLLPKLRWISCIGCSVDVDFKWSSLKKLVVLDLSECNISEDWSGWSQIEVGNKLKVLDLSYTYLRRTPDLSKFPNLERLILVECMDLVEIDPSIGKLKDLKFLNVSGCESLRSFPDELCSLNNLEVIWRYNAGGLRFVPKYYSRWRQSFTQFPRDFYMPGSIGNLESLLTLVLQNPSITELPESIGRLSRLRLLSLRWLNLSRLPDSLSDLKSLVELHLSLTQVSELPQRVGQLVKLKILKLDSFWKLKKLPDSIGDMRSLVELDLLGLGITELPATIGMLKRLEICRATYCESLIEIPSTIGGCTSLRILNISDCSRIKKLPDSIGDMRSLVELDLSHCSRIKKLPDSIGDMRSFVELNLSYSGITELPATIGMLKRLEICYASPCCSLVEIPSTIGGCTSLRILNFGGCSRIKKLPDSVGCLRMLAVLHLLHSGISELPDTIRNIEELRVTRNDGTSFVVADFYRDDERLVELDGHDSEFHVEIP